MIERLALFIDWIMDQENLKSLLRGFKEGQLSIDEAIERLRHLPFEDLGYARVDHHRALRQGFPEVIFGSGKTPEQIAGIAAARERRKRIGGRMSGARGERTILHGEGKGVSEIARATGLSRPTVYAMIG